VVASDRSIGGFGHTWGDGPKIQKKKRMLQEEGVVFEEEGKISKIRKDFFVESAWSASASPSNSTAKPKGKADIKGSKKRKPEEMTLKHAATANTKSKYFATSVSEETLKHEILSLLQKRDEGKTC